MVTTGYHYKGEKRRRKDNERQWRASFRRWVEVTMRTVRAKDARNEPLSEAESAVKLYHFLTSKKEAAA